MHAAGFLQGSSGEVRVYQLTTSSIVAVIIDVCYTSLTPFDTPLAAGGRSALLVQPGGVRLEVGPVACSGLWQPAECPGESALPALLAAGMHDEYWLLAHLHPWLLNWGRLTMHWPPSEPGDAFVQQGWSPTLTLVCELLATRLLAAHAGKRLGAVRQEQGAIDHAQNVGQGIYVRPFVLISLFFTPSPSWCACTLPLSPTEDEGHAITWEGAGSSRVPLHMRRNWTGRECPAGFILPSLPQPTLHVMKATSWTWEGSVSSRVPSDMAGRSLIFFVSTRHVIKATKSNLGGVGEQQGAVAHGRAHAQDVEQGVHVHQALAQLAVEPAQELQGAPQLQQQPLGHDLHHNISMDAAMRWKRPL